MGNISELSCPQIQKKAKQNTSICWKRTTFSLKKKFFFLIYAHHEACGILVPQPGVEPMPPAVEAWSLSHWTTREVLHTHTNDVACLVKNWKSDLLLLQQELSFGSCLLHGDVNIAFGFVFFTWERDSD